jgi:hypothetical protein
VPWTACRSRNGPDEEASLAASIRDRLGDAPDFDAGDDNEDAG